MDLARGGLAEGVGDLVESHRQQACQRCLFVPWCMFLDIVYCAYTSLYIVYLFLHCISISLYIVYECMLYISMYIYVLYIYVFLYIYVLLHTVHIPHSILYISLYIVYECMLYISGYSLVIVYPCVSLHIVYLCIKPRTPARMCNTYPIKNKK